MDEALKKLKKMSDSYKKLSKKLKLFNLLNKAKEEYDKYDYDSARATLLESLSQFPNNAEILRGLGCVEQFDNNFDKAVNYFHKSLKFSDKKEVDYTLLGMAYYLQEEYENAMKYFNMAIEINDNYTPAYEGRNQAMLEEHLKIIDLQEALEKCFNPTESSD